MGTLVARSLAARYPRLVNRLVLLGAVAQPGDAARSAQHERASTVRNGGRLLQASSPRHGQLRREEADRRLRHLSVSS